MRLRRFRRKGIPTLLHAAVFAEAWKVEWSFDSFRLAFGTRLSLDDDATLALQFGFGSIYITIEKVHRRDGRVIAFEFHNGTFWLRPWSRGGDWCSDDPWWVRGVTLDVADLLFGKAKYTKTDLESRPVKIPMYEGVYDGVATRSRQVWKRPRLPRPRIRTVWWIDVEKGVPAPGKWGEDGIFGTGHDGTLEDAIGHYVAAVLMMRVRHGRGHFDTGRRATEAS